MPEERDDWSPWANRNRGRLIQVPAVVEPDRGPSYLETKLDRENKLALGRMSAEAQKYPAMLGQERFNTVWPFLQGQFAASNQGGVAGRGSGPGPRIGVPNLGANSPLVNAQVNAMRAGAQRTAATQSREAGQKLAGQGFGSQNPLLRALEGMYQGRALESATQGESDLRYTAAREGADTTLKAQGLRESQFASRRDEEIRRQQVANQRQSALLAALAGMV